MLTAILPHSRSEVKLDPPVTEASIAAAKADAMSELREAAQIIARQQGHVLGRWRESNDSDVEAAFCRNCWRSAVIDGLRDPRLAGPALSEKCSGKRPDAFLANQHDGDTLRTVRDISAAIEGASVVLFRPIEGGK